MGATAAAVDTTGFGSTVPLRLAMHVHGSWSEGLASWAAQFTQAAATGVDVLYLTGHDNRATALGHLPSLAGITWVRSTTGSLARQAMTASGEAIQLLAESSSSTAPASVTMQIQPKPTADDHPFGYNGGPLLSPADRIAKRRQPFQSMRAVNQYETDILEVGYTLRGQVDTLTHLDLWDAFSRSGIWLTGNGVSDDHGGQHWSTLSNGFLTGAWATGRTDAELTTALAGGRAYTYHPGRWAGAGSRLRVVSGPVDYSGAVDPATTTVRALTPSAFTGNLATITVDTTTSRFYRATDARAPMAAQPRPDRRRV